MMKKVYFDTNVYTHIRNRQYDITDADAARFFAKLDSHKVKVYLSGALLEETVSALLSSEQDALSRLKMFHRMTPRKRVLNDYLEILKAIISAYATGGPVGSFFQSGHFLQGLLKNQSLKTIANLRKIAKESQQQIQQRKESTEQLFDGKIWPLVQRGRDTGAPQQSFDDYWDEHYGRILELFAEKSGLLDECRREGMAGLLEFTPMRAITVGILSQGYANTYENSAINRGDSRDLHHVVYAASIGTLVTHDRKFMRIMKRIPIQGFEVTDFHGLLEQL